MNYNKVIIGGRLTAAPELKTTQSGKGVTSFTVAVNRNTKDKKADFFNCTAWEQTAKFIADYFGKGSAIMVEGQLENREWQDKNGSKRISTDIRVERAFFTESKSASQTAENGSRGAEATPSDNYEDVTESDDLPF